jgi:uracil-DNA glycosylase family 4
MRGRDGSSTIHRTIIAVRRLAIIADEILACRACPRLVAHLAAVAAAKKREFAAWTYHGRPLPGWGDPRARIALVGLAPAAHGGARTGRVFTGDSSGAFLAAALHRAGLASQPTSIARDDGLRLRDTFIALAARCAPPANRPTPDELERCRPFLRAELAALPGLAVIVALGRIAWDAVLRAGVAGPPPRPAPRFAHGARVRVGRLLVLGSYHPSRQNTNTGRLIPAMLDAVLAEARRELETRSATR